MHYTSTQISYMNTAHVLWSWNNEICIRDSRLTKTEDSPPSETVVFKGLTPKQILKVLCGSQQVLT
jgi:hypothetical protein